MAFESKVVVCKHYQCCKSIVLAQPTKIVMISIFCFLISQYSKYRSSGGNRLLLEHIEAGQTVTHAQLNSPLDMPSFLRLILCINHFLSFHNFDKKLKILLVSREMVFESKVVSSRGVVERACLFVP